jgi:hypothetical protein
MAVLTVDDAGKGIANVTMVAAAGGGDSVAAGVKVGGWELPVAVVVRNGDASAKTVTVQGTPYVVNASGIALIPVRAGKYGDSVAITYSAVTNVTVGAAPRSRPRELARHGGTSAERAHRGAHGGRGVGPAGRRA